MVDKIATLYVTALPVILAGIGNMLVVKQKWFKDKAKPIDNNIILKDGKRILGNNKTWLGIFTMIICSMIINVIWGKTCEYSQWLSCRNQLYTYYDNSMAYNVISGAMLGLGYMIMELPNSFIKRRLNIEDGKTADGLKGKIFFIVDQIDSMIGISIVLVILSNIKLEQCMLYIIFGGITHISVNFILYKLKIRRNL